MNGMRRRVTRRSVAAWSSALGSRTEALHLAVTEAGDEVVVHHPHSLHEGITDGRPDKAEATLDERRAHRVRLTRPGGEIPQRASTVLLRRPTHEAPEKVAERAVAFLEVEEGPGVADRGIHFLAIADDPRILQKLRDLLAIVAGDTLGVEPVERLEETGALVQDDAPGEPGLEAIEHELGEQVLVAVERHTPLLVVIREHQRVVAARPAAPDDGTILHRDPRKKGEMNCASCTAARPARRYIAPMRYLRVVEEQGRYVASLPEMAQPTPARGEVLIRVTASGVNRADLSQIAGRYPPPPGESEILGLEVSGTLVETGEPVCALLAGGGHAEYVAAPAGQVFPAPAGLDLVTAAGIPEAFLTAFVNLIVEGGLEREATVLVHAGASGVGLAAIQISKRSGARVAATTRSADKLKALEAVGADLAIDTSRRDFAAEIEQRWGRDAVDVVLDPVGASTLPGDLGVLKTGGRIVVLSTMSGSEASLDLALLMRKRARIVGSTLRARSRAEKATIVSRFKHETLPGFANGAVRVVVDAVFPVARAAEVFQRMRENRNVGKILIAWRND